MLLVQGFMVNWQGQKKWGGGGGGGGGISVPKAPDP